MAQTWAQIKYNSVERSAELRKKRLKNEREMKGTYAQQAADKIARINLEAATKITQQKLANAGQLAAQQEQTKATTGAAQIRANASRHYVDTQVGEQARQWDAGAALRGEKLAQEQLHTTGSKLATLYIPEMLEQQASVGRKKKKESNYNLMQGLLRYQE